MIRILQSSWFISLTGCLLYLGTTAALIHPSQFAGAVAALKAAKLPPDDAPSWRFRNPEMDQWIADIKREREALALREQQLKDLQTRLDAERKELTTVTQTVHQLQSEFDKNVVRFTAQQEENLKKQVKVLQAMTPDSAVTMLSQMPDDDVVRILALMKPDQTSVMLENMSKAGKEQAQRAAELLERLRRVLPPPTAGRGFSSS